MVGAASVARDFLVVSPNGHVAPGDEMANEFYTLILVPHAKARFRKVQVPVRLTKWVLGVSGAAALCVSVLMVHFTRLRRGGLPAPARAQNQAPEHQDPGIRGELHASSRPRSTAPEHGHEARGHGGAGAGPSGPEARRRRRRAEPRDGRAGYGRAGGPAEHGPNVSELTERSPELEEFYRDQRALSSSTPSVWPVRGYLSAGFGNRIDPFTGQKDFHPGIDISTPIGTKVQAPGRRRRGLVRRQGRLRQRASSSTTATASSRATPISPASMSSPGQRVKRGDVIGFVGSTGSRRLPTSTTRSGCATRRRTPSTSSWTSTGRSARARPPRPPPGRRSSKRPATAATALGRDWFDQP